MMLRYGSRGLAVSKLQEALGLLPDGVFGQITEQEVKEFQAANGLVADGLVGPKTWAVLNKRKKHPEQSVEPFQMMAKCSRANALKWARPMAEAMAKFGIKSPKQIAMFIAQCSHESAHFKRISENLNYSVQGLANTWPKYFSTRKKITKNMRRVWQPNRKAQLYGRSSRQGANQKMIANIAYANRMGNGDVNSGDGWRYRGRGVIQLTGKNNYRACGKALGVDLLSNPDLLLEAKYAALSAAWFWSENGLNRLAGQGKINTVSRRINGGNNGLNDRRRLYAHALDVLDDIKAVA